MTISPRARAAEDALRLDAGCRQAEALRVAAEDAIARDGLIGIGAVGVGAAVLGGVVTALASAKRDEKDATRPYLWRERGRR